jgi:hypothetical protein
MKCLMSLDERKTVNSVISSLRWALLSKTYILGQCTEYFFCTLMQSPLQKKGYGVQILRRITLFVNQRFVIGNLILPRLRSKDSDTQEGRGISFQ